MKAQWRPRTKTGWRAVYFGLAAVIWGIIMPTPVVIPLKLLTLGLMNGIVMVIIEIVLVIAAVFYSLKAVFKEKDRSAISLIILFLVGFIGSFWIFFAVGEAIAPH